MQSYVVGLVDGIDDTLVVLFIGHKIKTISVEQQDAGSIPENLEKEMTTHSSILARIIAWTEGPGGLQSMGLQSWTQLND